MSDLKDLPATNSTRNNNAQLAPVPASLALLLSLPTRRLVQSALCMYTYTTNAHMHTHKPTCASGRCMPSPRQRSWHLFLALPAAQVPQAKAACMSNDTTQVEGRKCKTGSIAVTRECSAVCVQKYESAAASECRAEEL